MKSKLLFLVLMGVFLVSSVALADSIVTSGGGSWQSLPATLYPTTPGNPFWDNGSSDGTPNPGNIGYVLQSNLSTSLPVQNLQYWSLQPGNTVDPNVTFQGITAGQQETLVLEIAGNKSTNSLWAYDVTSPATQTLIFAGGINPNPNPVVVSKNIPYATYGFVMKTASNGDFYSGDVSSTFPHAQAGHFAFFKDSTQSLTWWFGIEDLNFCHSDIDYQDMIIRLDTQSGGGGNVPLPPSALLLGSGLVGLVALKWRRRNGKS